MMSEEPILASVNRNALIISPKPTMLKWVNSVCPDHPEPERDFSGHDESNVYLIPEMETTEESIEYFKTHLQFFWEEELCGWCEDDSLWPQDLSWETFNEFFSFRVHSIIYDTVPQRLEVAVN